MLSSIISSFFRNSYFSSSNPSDTLIPPSVFWRQRFKSHLFEGGKIKRGERLTPCPIKRLGRNRTWPSHLELLDLQVFLERSMFNPSRPKGRWDCQNSTGRYDGTGWFQTPVFNSKPAREEDARQFRKFTPKYKISWKLPRDYSTSSAVLEATIFQKLEFCVKISLRYQSTWHLGFFL